MALCHVTEITNQNSQKTMAVMKDTQLSKDFDGLYHAKGILLSALLLRVIHNIVFSVVLSVYFTKKSIECKISELICLFTIDWPRMHSELLGKFQGHDIVMTSCNKHNT